MLFEAVTSQQPIKRYKVLEGKLAAMGRDLSEFRKKGVASLNTTISVLEDRIRETRLNSGFHTFLENDQYIRDVYTKSALECLVEYKTNRDNSVILVPGMTYYSATKSNGRVVGKRCHYLNEDTSLWSQINEDERVLKAFEIMQWGNLEHFRKIYFEMADGREFEHFDNVVLEHVSESSDDALNSISDYCDQVWDGKWAWEIKTPNKLKDIIRESTEMTKQSVREYKEEFSALLNQLSEGEIERSTVITKMQGYVDDVDNMLEKLSRVSGSLLTDMRETIRAEFGDSAADELQETLGSKLSDAASGLGNLKSAWNAQVEKLANGGEPERAEFDADLGPEMDMDDEVDAMAELPDDMKDDEDFDGDEIELDDEDLGAERDKK
ncbi:hypothetical protein CL653_03525 [bacterium]|nr:hypothetical protein [bacterium]|tara:strand:- start:120 stop:1262 length:1143 start_codon:yes stop_codon:yes gene_type:complete